MAKKRNEESWDKLSDHYQGSRRISLENYHYGAYAPGDNELGIIGDVDNLDILEIGCGGGQNSIVLKRKGAKSVTGIDQSENQLKYARELAEKVGVDAKFIKCDMEDLGIFNEHAFDLIVSSHAMNYAFDIKKVFQECNRVLRPEGRLVTCINHPLWIVLGEALSNNDFEMLVNYFEGVDDIWDWEGYEGEKIATFHSKSWRLEHIINGLIQSGFVIERMAEPRGYSEEELNTLPLDAAPYRDIPEENKGFIRGNRIVPSALIVSSTKRL